MNSLQIEYFITVAETGSFSRGAEKLFVSTPAVSKQIATLESELGFKLFSRTSKGAELTPAGELMLDYTVNAKVRFSKLLEEAKSEVLLQPRRFTLGVVESWRFGDRTERLHRFLKELDPKLELLVLAGNGKEMLDWVASGEADAVITMGEGLTQRQIKHNQFFTRHLAYIRRGLLFSGRNPVAGKEDLSPADFADQPLYSLSNKQKFLAEEGNELLCRSYGFAPNIVPMDSMLSVFHTVSVGHGFTVVDEWNFAQYLPDFAWLPLQERHDVVLCWMREQDPVIQAVVRFCTEELFPGPGR